MTRYLIIAIALVSLAVTSGCVYRQNISQGNLIEQEDLDQVELGMTRNQIRFLLGTPMIDDPFHKDRWDYVYFLKIGRQPATFTRWVTVIFEEDLVSEIRKDQEEESFQHIHQLQLICSGNRKCYLNLSTHIFSNFRESKYHYNDNRIALVMRNSLHY